MALYGSDSDALSMYYRAMSATSPPDRSREALLAEDIQANRKRLMRILEKMPRDCRRFVRCGTDRSAAIDLKSIRLRLSQWMADRRSDALTRRLIGDAIDLVERALDAREKLIVANLRLVVHIARKYAAYGIPLADLIQEGNVGLVRAVDRFDPQRGNRLSTYAYHCIKSAIERSINAHLRSTLRLAVHQRPAGDVFGATAQRRCRHRLESL